MLKLKNYEKDLKADKGFAMGKTKEKEKVFTEEKNKMDIEISGYMYNNNIMPVDDNFDLDMID